MKIVVLANDTVIDDVLYCKGQVACVSDDFNRDILRVLVSPEEQALREQAQKDKIDSTNKKQKKPKVK
jgi:hypothetical protein